MEKNNAMPMLFPYEPEMFWARLQEMIREEIKSFEKTKSATATSLPPEFTYKPLYRTSEVCSLFHISKPTVYDWIKQGKLKPLKVSSRVYFLLKDIQELLQRRG